MDDRPLVVVGSDVLRALLETGDLELAQTPRADRWTEQGIDAVLREHRHGGYLGSRLAEMLLEHPAVDELHATDAGLAELLRRLDEEIEEPDVDEPPPPPPVGVEYVPPEPLYFVVTMQPLEPFVGADLLERLDAVRWFNHHFELIARPEDGPGWVLPEREGWYDAAPPMYRAAKLALPMVEEAATRDRHLLEPLWARIQDHLAPFQPRIDEEPAQTCLRASGLRRAAEATAFKIDICHDAGNLGVPDLLVRFGMWREGESWVRMSAQGWPWLWALHDDDSTRLHALPSLVEHPHEAVRDVFDLADALVGVTGGVVVLDELQGVDAQTRRTEILRALETCRDLGICPGTPAAADLFRVLYEDRIGPEHILRPHERYEIDES